MFFYLFMYFILKSVLINFIIFKININVLNIFMFFISKFRYFMICKGVIEVRLLGLNWLRLLFVEVDYF